MKTITFKIIIRKNKKKKRNPNRTIISKEASPIKVYLVTVNCHKDMEQDIADENPYIEYDYSIKQNNKSIKYTSEYNTNKHNLIH